LVGTSSAGLVFSEWALSYQNAWTYLSPIVEENNGWAIFATTPRGENHATQLYDYAKRATGWYAQLLRATDCGVFSEAQLDRIRDELIEFLGEDEGDAKYRQEYECSREAALPGAYYAKLITRADDEGRIGEVPHIPGFPVDTAWDLGVADDTSIWFSQRVGTMIHLIDYYEGRGEGAAHYAGVL
jgi:phage terminase large subunit